MTLEADLKAAQCDLRSAEEEKTNAHDQVLSLIRECNALEDQVHIIIFRLQLRSSISGS